MDNIEYRERASSPLLKNEPNRHILGQGKSIRNKSRVASFGPTPTPLRISRPETSGRHTKIHENETGLVECWCAINSKPI